MADQVAKRLNIASKGVDAATRLVDALNDLVELSNERPYAGNFLDADFIGTDLKHLDAGTIGVLFDFVVPSLSTNYADASNAGRNKQILLQVRK